MYNLNVNVSTSSGSAVNSLLTVENSNNTPLTPEIVNSLIAMTNPLDGFNFTLTPETTNCDTKSGICQMSAINDSCSNSSGSQTESPTSPPSVQHTCSQLIKAGLKLSIQSKRKHSGDSIGGGELLDLDLASSIGGKKRKIVCKGEITGSEDEYDGIFTHSTQGLTPEDEERRRRRRERNKIAATKCRLKKREKTVNLVHESETLETQNIELKTEIKKLETERRRLVDMLSMHSPACVKQNCIKAQTGNQYGHHETPTETYILSDITDSANGYGHHTEELNCLPPVTSLSNSVIETNGLSYSSRPASVDISLSYRQHENYNRPSSVGVSLIERSNQYGKPPSIIVNEPSDDYTSHLTNLDNPSGNYQINSHCHNYDSNNGNSGQSYTNSGMDNGCMA